MGAAGVPQVEQMQVPAMAEEVIEAMTERLIGKNATERVRVAVSDFRGGRFVDARVWVQTGDGDSWVPTKKGLTLKPEVAREVAEAMATVAGEVEGDDDK